MSTIAATKLSSRGQVVIPLKIREALNLQQGDSLVVAVRGEHIILRKLSLDDLLDESEYNYHEGKTLSHEDVFGKLT